jgi:hypothetical protein
MESFIGMLEAEEARRKAAADASGRGSDPEGAVPTGGSSTVDTGTAPPYSIKGALQRIPPVQDLVQAPGRLVNTVGRYGGALLGGLWSGDYSVPKQGLVDMASNQIADTVTSAAPGRPITSAPPVFPTPTTWWAAGR